MTVSNGIDHVEQLSFEKLQAAVEASTALRLRRRLQPAGGAGDKVFPPTYEGSVYSLEDRIIGGTRRPCVLLDSVQSQANRMELVLLDAQRRGDIPLPVLTVDFSSALPEVGRITSLEVPHRMADAILRDSEYDAKKFRDSAPGRVLNDASLECAEGLLAYCPTALLFGLWDSAGPRGGLGAKFQRALVGEIVGVNVETGKRPSSRLDPLQILASAGPLYAAREGVWTLDETEAAKDKEGNPVPLRPSEVNHGNVTPSLEHEGKFHHGGVTMEYAFQSVVLSLPALRRLHFSPKLEERQEKDPVAWTALAALGLCGATLAVERGCDLRSRCLLVPEEPAVWEVLENDGTRKSVTLDGAAACELMRQAVQEVKKAGLAWYDEGLILTPQKKLVDLVQKSRKLMLQSDDGKGE